MAKTIAIVGTLDTKFEEMGYIRDFTEQKGYNALIVDGGILGNPPFMHVVKEFLNEWRLGTRQT